MKGKPDPSSWSALYALLGRLFAGEIDQDFFRFLKSPEIAWVFLEEEPECFELDLEEAATEYCRLFVLPRGVSPRAAAWMGDGDPARSATIPGLVENLKAVLGLSLPNDLPPDHLACLLQLMAWLIDEQPDAAGDFFDTALEPWIHRFAAALKAEARLSLYRVGAGMLFSLDKDFSPSAGSG